MPLHPVTVHFPIAFLILAAVLFTVELFTKKPEHKLFALIVMSAGVGGAALAVLTGNFEYDGGGSETLQEMVETHELLGYIVLWVYGIFAVWAWMRKTSEVKIEKIAFVVLFWIGIGVVGYTSHLGGKMVYEEGAGVIPMQTDEPEPVSTFVE